MNDCAEILFSLNPGAAAVLIGILEDQPASILFAEVINDLPATMEKLRVCGCHDLIICAFNEVPAFPDQHRIQASLFQLANHATSTGELYQVPLKFTFKPLVMPS